MHKTSGTIHGLNDGVEAAEKYLGVGSKMTRREEPSNQDLHNSLENLKVKFEYFMNRASNDRMLIHEKLQKIVDVTEASKAAENFQKILDVAEASKAAEELQKILNVVDASKAAGKDKAVHSKGVDKGKTKLA